MAAAMHSTFSCDVLILPGVREWLPLFCQPNRFCQVVYCIEDRMGNLLAGSFFFLLLFSISIEYVGNYPQISAFWGFFGGRDMLNYSG